MVVVSKPDRVDFIPKESSIRETRVMQASEIKSLVPQVIAIAIQAGNTIRRFSGQSLNIRTKSDDSPVTAADCQAHEIICLELGRLPMRLPAISEESYQDTDRLTLANPSDPYWLIDPLDGTKEFIKGLGDYTVNIALIEDGRPIMGVVYAPATDTCYHAAEGSGATRISTDGHTTALLSVESHQEPLVAVASRSHINPQTEALLRKLQVKKTIARGSSIKMCAVAEGQAHVYPRIGPTHLWDTAAGTIIAREAGCLVIDLQGRDLRYDIHQGILHTGFVVVPKGNHALVHRVKSILEHI